MSQALDARPPSLATDLAPPPSRFEPVALVPHAPPPPADIAPAGRGGWLARLLPLLIARRRKLMFAVATAVVALGAQVAVPRVVMAGIDEGLAPGGPGVTGYAVVIAALAVVRSVFTWLHRDVLFRFSYDLEGDLRTLIYAHLGRLSLPFFDRARTGDLISRANTDIRAVQMVLTYGPLMVLNVGAFCVAFALMLSVSVPLTIVALAPMPLVVWVGMRMRRDLYPLSWLVQARQSTVASIVEENVTGVRVVRALSGEQRQLDALALAARGLAWASVRQLDVRGRDAPVLENLPRLGMVGVLAVGGWLALRGQATIGAIVAFSTYVVLLQAPFRMIGAIIMMWQRAAASAGRIYELLDQRATVTDQAGASELDDVRGEVEFRNVTFGYRAGQTILRDFNLRIAAGETVALVGSTGSGKSTVARLLTRSYDVESGAVTVDGHDVRQVALASLRAAVSTVPDEPFLFAETVHDAIAYGRPDATRQEVERAARAAGASEFVDRLPDGYDTVLAERGYSLSGGQRQRLAIARTLLVNPPIVVFDDATSAVDARTEQAIHEALGQLRHRRTTVLIAHRMSTIALADRVVLLHGGRVVAEGRHRELLANEPRYRAVLARQRKAEQGTERPPVPR